MTFKDIITKDQSIKSKPIMTDSQPINSVSSFNVSALKEIPKLTSGNIVSWKQGLKVHLKMNGLFGFVKISQSRPLTHPECDYFDMRQAAVLHAIRSTIDEANRSTIDTMDDPKVVYDALILQHGNDDGFTAANTLAELFNTRYDVSVPMNEYLAKIQDLHSRICDLTSGDPDLKISDKLFSIVLVNSLPRVRYGTVIQQLLANVKTLTMAQVTARLRLEAVSMSSDQDKFKDVYTAKIVRNEKRSSGKGPKDLCHIHPNGRHLNEACFQQKDRTTASASNSQLSDAKIVQRYKSLFSYQPKPDQKNEPVKTGAVAATTNTQDDDFITYSAYTASANLAGDDPNQFLLDTGANTHLTHDSTLLHDIHTITPVFINGIAGTTGKVMANQSGSANIVCTDLSGAPRTLEIKNVLLVPESRVNLIAVSSISNNGGSFSGDNNHIKLTNTKKNYVINGVGANGLYKVKACKISSLLAVPASIPTDIWHRRFGHLHNRMLAKVSPAESKSQWCEACALAKAHQLPFSSSLPMSDSPLFRIHSDVVGPMPVASTGGARYIVSFIDDATRYNHIFAIKTKSQVFSCFVKFLNTVERFHESHIKILKSDRGGEYLSNEFTSYLDEKGISFERAPPETPEQNPVSERFN